MRCLQLSIFNSTKCSPASLSNWNLAPGKLSRICSKTTNIFICDCSGSCTYRKIGPLPLWSGKQGKNITLTRSLPSIWPPPWEVQSKPYMLRPRRILWRASLPGSSSSTHLHTTDILYILPEHWAGAPTVILDKIAFSLLSNTGEIIHDKCDKLERG